MFLLFLFLIPGIQANQDLHKACSVQTTEGEGGQLSPRPSSPSDGISTPVPRRSTPHHARVPSTLSHTTQVQEDGRGAVLACPRPPSLLTPSQAHLHCHASIWGSGQQVEWPFLPLHKISAHYTPSFPHPSLSPIIGSVHTSYRLSVSDLYQPPQKSVPWLLKCLMLLGIPVHAQKN